MAIARNWELGSETDKGLALLGEYYLRWLGQGLVWGLTGDDPSLCWNHIQKRGYETGQHLRFAGAPADWPTVGEVEAIEAGHRSQPACVSWNQGPVLFDYERDDYIGE